MAQKKRVLAEFIVSEGGANYSVKPGDTTWMTGTEFERAKAAGRVRAAPEGVVTVRTAKDQAAELAARDEAVARATDACAAAEAKLDALAAAARDVVLAATPMAIDAAMTALKTALADVEPGDSA